MPKKSKAKKKTSKQRAADVRAAAGDRQKPEPEIREADEPTSALLIGLGHLKRQTELLEVIAKSTARLMMIADGENRMAGEERIVADPHGLRRDVEKLLTRDAMTATLIVDTDGSANENSDSTSVAD